MKKIVIAVLSVLVFTFILIVLITNLSSFNYNKNNKLVEKHFVSKNKNITDIAVEQYYGDNQYYIVSYKSENKEYLSILDEKENKIFNIEKTSLYNLKKDFKIGYKYDKLIYEVKEVKKDGFTYSYYDALTGEFIKSIKLNK